MKCRACGTLFYVATSSLKGQRKPEKNRTVFIELVTKKPIRGIAEVTGLSPKAIYDKIDLLDRQCQGFLGEREAEAHRKSRGCIRLCTDKQDYMINWRSKSFRRNVYVRQPRDIPGTKYIL